MAKDKKKLKAKSKPNKATEMTQKELLASLADGEENFQVASKGGGGSYTPAAKGTTLGRFVSYVEVGMQKQNPYQGQKKPPADMTHWTFELLKDKNIRTVQVNGKDVEITDKITIKMPKSSSDKAGYFKLFNRMRNERQDIVHPAQMLGEGFICKVVHKESDDKKTVYAGLKDPDNNGVYFVDPPYKIDPEDDDASPVKVKVPPAREPLKVFLWKKPTLATWDSLFIDGQREFEEGGKKVKVSKNWLQEMILKAENFPHSPLYDLLEGNGTLPDIEDLEDDEDESEEDEEETEEEDEDTEDADDSDDEEAEEEDDSEDESEEESDEDLDEDDDTDSEDESDDDLDADDSDEDTDEVDDEEEDEEEEEEPAPKKKAKVVPAKKPAAKVQKSVPSAKAKSSSTKSSKGTTSAAKTTSPSKGKPKSSDALAILGLKKK